jgi:hypothetical protein
MGDGRKGVRLIQVLFAAMAIWDAGMGLVALFAPVWMFRSLQIPSPEDWGYVRFPGALLVIFAAMFASIACKPVARRGLMLYGVALKWAYAGVVVSSWVTTGVSDAWKPFAVFDGVVGLLFLWAYLSLGKLPASTSGQGSDAQPARIP